MSNLDNIVRQEEQLKNCYERCVSEYGNLRWGCKQTKELNDLLTWEELDTKNFNKFIEILHKKNLTPFQEHYCITRWFTRRISYTDEAEFCMNDGVSANPDRKGDWDFSIHGVKLDLKSTIYPRSLLKPNGKLPDDWYTPEATHKLINYEYGYQSGCRKKFNSRLFLVCHSDFGDERTDKLRMSFTDRIEIISEFCNTVETGLGWLKWSDKFKDSVAQVIYFVETEKGKINNKHFISFK